MVEDSLIAVEYRGHVCFADSHADGVADTLTERARSRFDAWRISVLGMSRRLALPLPELFQVVESELIAGEVEHTVQKHRCVSGRQHEAIAIQPIGIGGIVAEVLGPEHVRERRQRHWSARMSRVGFLDRIHRQDSDRIDAEILEGLAGAGRGRGGC